MLFKPEQIMIPSKKCQEIPIGMIGSIPVGLTRNKDGLLLIDTTLLSGALPEETPEAISQEIDKLFIYLVHFHPELLNLARK
ncbi:MAG: hypothetical protein AAB338_02820 [Patescibacteria group bacterium]